ncbi:MAG: HAMP domain-containing protein, partial [Lysobacterales bacterium]
MNLSRLLSSTTFRLTLVYTALSLGSMLLLLGFIYWATAGYMNREVNATIDEEIIGLAEQYRLRGLPGLTATIEERVTRDTEGAALYLLADSRFQPLIGNLQRWPDGGRKSGGRLDFEAPQTRGSAGSTRPARARTFVLSEDLHLLVGRDIGDLTAATRLVLDALLWGGLLAGALVLASGLFMSSRVMQRLETVNETSREIMDGDLTRRVPTTGGEDEFEQLAVNLNRMFDRIEALVQTVRQVSDNIAHDLRTPLTRLRTRLEQCRDSDPQQMKIEIDRAIEDAEELLVTFNALLRIARIESGNCAMNLVSLNVADLLRD